MSIEVTQGQELNAFIEYDQASHQDEAYLIIYVNKSPIFSFLTKEDEPEKALKFEDNYQIGEDGYTGYSFSISANKTKYLKDTSTYKLFVDNVLVASGTFEIFINEDEEYYEPRIERANYFICDTFPDENRFVEGTIITIYGQIYVLNSNKEWIQKGEPQDVFPGRYTSLPDDFCTVAWKYSGCNFAKATFSNKNMQGAWQDGLKMTGADLTFANISNCSMDFSDFRGSNLNDSIMNNSNMKTNDFRWAYMNRVTAQGTGFQGSLFMSVRDSDFTGASLNNTVWIEDGQVWNVNMTSINAGKVDWSKSHVFRDVNCTSAFLKDAKMPKSFSGTYINFTSAVLENVDFSKRNLTIVNLTAAQCAGANFTGCTMPANADTKEKFKALVGTGKWNATTTIWTDGNPIGA